MRNAVSRAVTEESAYWPEDLRFLWDRKLTRNDVAGLSAIRGFYYQCLYSLPLIAAILSDRITGYTCEVPEDFTTWSIGSDDSLAELTLIQIKTSLPACFLKDAARVRSVLKAFQHSLKSLGPDIRPAKLDFRIVVNRHTECGTECERRARVRQRRALSTFARQVSQIFPGASVTITFEHFLPIPADVSDFVEILDFLRKDEPELLAFLQASDNAKALIQNLVGMVLPYHTTRTGSTLRDAGREPLSLIKLQRGRTDALRELRTALGNAKEQARRSSMQSEQRIARQQAAGFAQRELEGRRTVKTIKAEPGSMTAPSPPQALQTLTTIYLLKQANVPSVFDDRQLRVITDAVSWQITPVPEAGDSLQPLSDAAKLSHRERLELILAIVRTFMTLGRCGLSFAGFRAALNEFRDLYCTRRDEHNRTIFVIGDVDALRVWESGDSLLTPEWIRGGFIAEVLRYVYYGATDGNSISESSAFNNRWTDNLISDIADSLEGRYLRAEDLYNELARAFRDDLLAWPLLFADIDAEFIRDTVDNDFERGSGALLQVKPERVLLDRGAYSGRVLYVFSGTAQIALRPVSRSTLSLYRYNPYVTRRWERRRDRDLAASIHLEPPPGRGRSRVVLIGVPHPAIIPDLLKEVFDIALDEYNSWLSSVMSDAEEKYAPLPPLLQQEEKLLLARRQRLDLLSDPAVAFELRSDEEGELLPGSRVQLCLRFEQRLSPRLQRLNYTHLDTRSGLSVKATDRYGRKLTGSLERFVTGDVQEYLDIDIKHVDAGFEDVGTCRIIDEGADAVIRSEETLLRDLYFGFACGLEDVSALRAWKLVEPYLGAHEFGERSNSALWSGKMKPALVGEASTTDNLTAAKLYNILFSESERCRVQVLTGAPGTGKTRVAAALTDLFFARNRDRLYPPARVLVVAASHFAIDNFLRTFMALASVDVQIYRNVPLARIDRLRNSRVLDPLVYDAIEQDWERHKSDMPAVRPRHAERVNLKDYIASLEARIARLPDRVENVGPPRGAFVPSHEEWRTTQRSELSWLSDREPHFQRSYLVSKCEEFSRAGDDVDETTHEKTRSDRLYRQFAADLIATTPDGFDRLPDLHFDLVIFEEASQLAGLKLLKVLTKVLRPLESDSPPILLSGDRAQLPPFLETFSEAGETADPESEQAFSSLLDEYRMLQSLRTKETIFDRLCQRAQVETLDVQRRMHPQIASLINSLFYSDQQWHCISDGDSAGGVTWLDTSLKQARPKKQGTSLYNRAEIDAIRSFVKGLEGGDGNVLVIAPYVAQVGLLIRDLGPSVTVRTIDGCQGVEADVVIVSFVSFRLLEKSRFVVDPRRMNVAMSRARKNLILVGDFQSLALEVRNREPDPRFAHLHGLVALFGPNGPLAGCRKILPL